MKGCLWTCFIQNSFSSTRCLMNVKERGANKESAHLFFFLDSNNISLVPCLNEREVSELMEHFSLLRPLNANDERWGKKWMPMLVFVKCLVFMLGEGGRASWDFLQKGSEGEIPCYFHVKKIRPEILVENVQRDSLRASHALSPVLFLRAPPHIRH